MNEEQVVSSPWTVFECQGCGLPFETLVETPSAEDLGRCPECRKKEQDQRNTDEIEIPQTFGDA